MAPYSIKNMVPCIGIRLRRLSAFTLFFLSSVLVIQSPARAFPDAIPNNDVTVTLIQPDGNILVGGYFDEWSGTRARNLVRLFPDGSLDMTFVKNVNAITTFLNVTALAVQADGRILVGDNKIQRLLKDGSLDTSFVPEAIPQDSWANVNSIVVQPDGRILVGGESRTFPNKFLPSFGFVSRILPSGALDISFRDLIPEYFVDHKVTLGSMVRWYPIGGKIKSLVLEPSGHVLIGGELTTWLGSQVGNVVRLDPNGEIDLTFTNAIRGKIGGVNTMVRLTSGELMVSEQVGLTRVSSTGSTTRLWQAAIDESILALAVLPNDQLYVGGVIKKWGSQGVANLVRVNRDGLLDPYFDTTLSLAPAGKVTGISITQTSSLIVSGVLISVGTALTGRLIDRLDSSGRVLATSTPGIPRTPRARAVSGGAIISWSLPASTGGSTVTSYSVTASPSGKKCTWTSPRGNGVKPLRCTILGLRRGRKYSFVITARNQVGASVIGARTNSVVVK